VVAGIKIFNWAKRLVWQDAKLGSDRRFPIMDPMNYFEKTVEAQGACVSYMGLPVHSSTMGHDGGRLLHSADYYRHCEAIVGSNRANVTDDREGLMIQCLKYIYEAFIETGSTQVLSNYLIDSALIVWDLRPKRCSEFNLVLQCKWLNEIDCYSDRDQVSFPYVLYRMHLLRLEHKNHALLVDAANSTMVQIVHSQCHWYFTENANTCIDRSQQPERVAVLVTGSIHRFQLKSSVKLLIKPLLSHGFEVDAYVRLHMPAPRADIYELSEHRNFKMDPLLGSDPLQLQNATFLENILKRSFQQIGFRRSGPTKAKHKSGSRLRHVSFLSHRDLIDVVNSDKRIRIVRQEAKSRYPDEDMDLRFPLNNALSAQPTDSELNRDLISRYLSLEHLWVVLHENEFRDRRQYQFVVFIREDTKLTSEFALPTRKLDYSPDIFLWMCDSSSLIVSRRSRADFFALYLSSLVEVREACIGRVCSSDGLFNAALRKFQLANPSLVIENAASLTRDNATFSCGVRSWNHVSTPPWYLELNDRIHNTADVVLSPRTSVLMATILNAIKFLVLSVLGFVSIGRVFTRRN
jgi:hypothetical protein